MHIAIVFFSATNNTKTMAKTIKSAFEANGATVDLYDVTTPEAREAGVDPAAYDAMVFGFPIHSLRAPRLMREWLETLDGNGMNSAMFFTYGGFMIHPAHFTTARILQQQGFRVVSSAHFPGKHTYNLGGWKAFPDRPDAREHTLANQYAEATYRRFTGEDPGTISALDQGDFSEDQLTFFETLRFKMVSKLPSRDGAECSLCGQCGEVCPTGAMDPITGHANPDTCIACLGCVAACPENALKINSTTKAWQAKLAAGNITEAELNSQTGVIYL